MPRYKEGKPVLIEKLDIPIFFIKRLGDRQFIVGGGGGSSKTGVPNAVYLFSLTNRNGRCFLRQGQKVDVGAACPMNAAVYEIRSSSRSPVVIDPRPRILQSKTPAGGSSGQTGPPQAYPSGNAPPPKAKGLTKTERLEKEMRLLFDNARELIAVGLNNSCAIYQVQRSLCKGIQQHSGKSGEPGPAVVSKDDLLSISFREKIVTVPEDNGAQQCCIFLPPDPTKRSNLQLEDSAHASSGDASLVTGGTDGMLRLWENAEFDPSLFIKAHEGEFIDMDLSYTGDELITCGKDKLAHVWHLKSLKRIASVLPEFSEAKHTEYRPRKVRFHSKDSAVVYVIWIPTSRQRKRSVPSVIAMYRFRTSKLALTSSVPVKGDHLSALTTSPDGHYIAAGGLDGNVFIYRAENLSPVYSAYAAHETFVTDLEFTDCTFGARILSQTDNARCTVFSVSADRKIIMHQADFLYARLKKWKKWMKIIPLIWLFVVVITQLLDYVGYFDLSVVEM